MMSAQWYQAGTDDTFGCAELPCVHVEVGVMHHPYCGMRRDDPDIYPPNTPDEEETFPPDPEAAR